MIHPLEIKKEADSLKIIWADNTVSSISNLKLRQLCPCAGCREARGDESHQKPLAGKKSSLRVIKSTVEQETSLDKIWTVGNYAIGISWGDGHSTGIYTYDYLAEL